MNAGYAFPQTTSDADKNASQRNLDFNLGWFAHPIYSSKGNYPDDMIRLIREKSAPGDSRLPVFTADQLTMLKGFIYFC